MDINLMKTKTTATTLAESEIKGNYPASTHFEDIFTVFLPSQSASKAYSRTSFHVSAEAVTWFEANDHCRRQFDSPLFDPTSDPVEISMAEDYVEHIRGQVIGDAVEGFDEGVWTGVVDDEGQCQVRELKGTTAYRLHPVKRHLSIFVKFHFSEMREA